MKLYSGRSIALIEFRGTTGPLLSLIALCYLAGKRGLEHWFFDLGYFQVMSISYCSDMHWYASVMLVT